MPRGSSTVPGFPFALSEAQRAPATVLDEDLTTAQILVVDDNLVARGFIALHLRTNGFLNISLVTDGSEALKAMDASRPELVITDLLMPNMDGLELCRRLRADPNTAKIPVLAQSATTDPDVRAKAFACGASDLLAKPFDPRELLYRVRILLERGRLIERLSDFQQRMADELLQATATQEAMLPSDAALERIKAACPIDVAGHYQASDELGGDFWGIELVGDQRVLIFNTDFAGHGLGAALNTIRLHSFINGGPEKSRNPAALLTQLNAFLCDVLPCGQYATMFCAVMDFHACSLEYATAAAPPQLLRSGADQPFEIIQKPSFPLGVTRDSTYENFTAPFAPGAKLLLFSDALIETLPHPDEAFTENTLRDFVETLAPEGGPHELRDSVLREFYSRISAKPTDDLTIVAAHHLITRHPR